MPGGRRKKKELLKNAKKEDEDQEKEEERQKLVEEERLKEEERRNQQQQTEAEALQLSGDKIKELEEQVQLKMKEKKEEEEKRKKKKKEDLEKKKKEEEELLEKKRLEEEEKKIAEMTAALRIEAERAAERKKKEGELNLLEGTVAAAAVEEPLFSLFDDGPNEAHLPQKKKDVDFHQPLDQSMIYHRQQPQRGPIDQKADAVLDQIQYSVPILKHGKVDGIYRFGARILRIQLSASQTPIVQKYPLNEFIQKYEKTEILRLQGLKSAMLVVNGIGFSQKK